MKLYSYERSTTSYRLRAALNLKGLAYDIMSADLVAGGFDMASCPPISRIETACLAHPAIYAARPENHPDAPCEMKAPACP